MYVMFQVVWRMNRIVLIMVQGKLFLIVEL